MSYSLAVYLARISDIAEEVERASKLGVAKLNAVGRAGNAPQSFSTRGEISARIQPNPEIANANSPVDWLAVAAALRAACEKVGERLDAPLFTDTTFVFLKEVEYALPLVNRGLLGWLPNKSDFAGIGYLTFDECKSHTPLQFDHPHYAVRAGRCAVADWIDAAVSERKDLVGFWS